MAGSSSSSDALTAAASPSSLSTSASGAGSTPASFGTTAASSGSQFAPLSFSTTPAAPLVSPATTSRHPIFSDHITNHIKFLLDPAAHNYHKWKSFFLMVLLRYGVSFLLEHPLPPNANPHLLELDAHVALWIYATLADPLVDHVVGATTTYTLWKKITGFFLANRAARFMLLNRQYRNLKQGVLSVMEYARRLKLLTDDLANIDHVVTEASSPSFDTVLSRVVLAKKSMEQRADDESVSAFALPGDGSSTGAGSSGGGSRPQPDRGDRPGPDCPNGAPHPQQPSPGRGRGDRGDGGDRGRGRGRGRGGGRHDSSGRGNLHQPQFSPFTGYFAPYDMALPSPRLEWVPPNAGGVLGPRPNSHAQAYPLYHPPTSSAAPFFPPQPASWDHVAMLNAAYNNGGSHAHGLRASFLGLVVGTPSAYILVLCNKSPQGNTIESSNYKPRIGNGWLSPAMFNSAAPKVAILAFSS
ncbi:hypothetical protein D1007_62165 [Hordeum vulgare]|nr:hypothetical protein D1007_62165 [Hordeum vulgare]